MSYNPPDSKSTSVTSFVLSEGLPPMPAKLVAKNHKGDYVDMADFYSTTTWSTSANRQPPRVRGPRVGGAWPTQLDNLSWHLCQCDIWKVSRETKAPPRLPDTICTWGTLTWRSDIRQYVPSTGGEQVTPIGQLHHVHHIILSKSKWRREEMFGDRSCLH